MDNINFLIVLVLSMGLLFGCGIYHGLDQQENKTENKEVNTND